MKKSTQVSGAASSPAHEPLRAESGHQQNSVPHSNKLDSASTMSFSTSCPITEDININITLNITLGTALHEHMTVDAVRQATPNSSSANVDAENETVTQIRTGDQNCAGVSDVPGNLGANIIISGISTTSGTKQFNPALTTYCTEAAEDKKTVILTNDGIIPWSKIKTKPTQHSNMLERPLYPQESSRLSSAGNTTENRDKEKLSRLVAVDSLLPVRDGDAQKSTRMLVLLSSGEQRLITFTLPRGSCTVQELLQLVEVPFASKTSIQCVSYPGAHIDYVVTVGMEAQESANKLISNAENAFSAQQETKETQSEAIKQNSTPDSNTGEPATTLASKSSPVESIEMKKSTQVGGATSLPAHEPPRAKSVHQQNSVPHSNKLDSDTTMPFSTSHSITENTYTLSKVNITLGKRKRQATPNSSSANVDAEDATATQIRTGGENCTGVSVVPGNLDGNIIISGSSTTSDTKQFNPALTTYCTESAEDKKTVIPTNDGIIPGSKIKNKQRQLSNMLESPLCPQGSSRLSSTENTTQDEDAEKLTRPPHIQPQHIILGSQNTDAGKIARMLVILSSGERKLIRFTLPREGCTVQDVLQQVGVPFTSKTNIQCDSYPGAHIEYFVKVGMEEQESTSELISNAENAFSTQQEIQATQSAAIKQNSTLDSNTPGPAATLPSSSSATSQLSQAHSQIEKPQSQETKNTPQAQLIAGYYAVCSFCGFNNTKCERCKRAFIEPPRIYEVILSTKGKGL